MNTNSIFKNVVVILGTIGALSACSLSGIVDVDEPQVGSDIDHDHLDTKAGALALFYSSMASLQVGISETSKEVGILTDELTALNPNSPDALPSDFVKFDTRVELDVALGIKGIQSLAYADLHTARMRANYARHFMRRQSDVSLNYAISGAYSFEGYAIMILAENLCSGVPLSSSPYGEKAVYGRALPTDSLLIRAIAHFDSALAIPHDSIRFITLAKIGKARALVSLKRFSDANAVVSDIQPTDEYILTYSEVLAPGQTTYDAFWTASSSNSQASTFYKMMETINREGNNGLNWFVSPTAIDPRLPVTVVDGSFPAVVRQEKYKTGSIQFKLASWIEAKMIEAEYLLSINDPTWILPLNAARNTVGLADTVSPATTAQKVDLLFRERAFWFYAHGTRLSDMRRLVRQYGRSRNIVFPIGNYSRHKEIFSYGDAVVFIPPVQEFQENYNYSGCINRNP